MNCLSRNQLAQLVLGLDDGDDRSVAHLKSCTGCREELASLRSLFEGVSAAHAKLNCRHAECRAKLIAKLPVAAKPRARHVSERPGSWFGGLNMAHRVAMGTSGMMFVLVAVLLIWTSNLQTPVSAMERMAERIRSARSYTVRLVSELGTGTIYWVAPGSMRIELGNRRGAVVQSQTDILPAGKEGIRIDHHSKTFRRLPARGGYVSPLMMLEALGTYSGKAERDLGVRQINRRNTRGFAIEARKIDQDAFPGTVEVWIDTETNLPVELRYEMEIGAGRRSVLRMTDFQWNVDLDRKLFEPTPPDGYADATPEPHRRDEIINQITEAFKLYAELSGGHYPRKKMIYGDVMMSQMRKMAGLTGRPTKEQLANKQFIKRFNRVQQATRGCAAINGILRDNPDAAYHGLTVGPDDKDKVLIRWKLDHGRYQVIYGDLYAAVVTADRLRSLEGK